MFKECQLPRKSGEEQNTIVHFIAMMPSITRSGVGTMDGFSGGNTAIVMPSEA